MIRGIAPCHGWHAAAMIVVAVAPFVGSIFRGTRTIGRRSSGSRTAPGLARLLLAGDGRGLSMPTLQPGVPGRPS
jgi:hypothetical protein